MTTSEILSEIANRADVLRFVAEQAINEEARDVYARQDIAETLVRRCEKLRKLIDTYAKMA